MFGNAKYYGEYFFAKMRCQFDLANYRLDRYELLYIGFANNHKRDFNGCSCLNLL